MSETANCEINEFIQQFFEFSFLVTKYKENDYWVLYNWTNTMNVIINDKHHPLYEILEIGKTTFNPFNIENSYSDFHYLYENNFIVENKSKTIKIIEEKYSQTNRRSKLELILMNANQACNFNCIYCYQDHNSKKFQEKNNTHFMGDYECTALEKFISNQEIDELAIDYYGGEPLLNWKFILKFNGKMLETLKNRDISFTSSMTSNGYNLTKELFLKLHHVKVSNFQITIDGLQEDHDSLRPLKSGKGTFSKIYSNLIEISKLPVDLKFIIVIRINFNERTATKEKIENFLTKFNEDLENDKRFIIYPHVIADFKGTGNSTLSYTSKEDADAIIKEYTKCMLNTGLNHFDIVNLSWIESDSCYADKKNSLLVFPASMAENKTDITIKKCTTALDDDINTVGYITKDGHIILNDNYKIWVSDSPFKKEECKSCFFVLNCYGSACPLHSIKQGVVSCPPAKGREFDIVKQIMHYISAN